MKINNLAFLLFVLVTTVSLAQNNTVVSGGQATGAGGSVSYSLGQIDYLNKANSTGYINEGNQQPYEIFLSTAINESVLYSEITVFPSPTTDNLFLNVAMSDIKNMSYSINNVDGKLIFSQELYEMKTSVNMNNLSNGVYFIKVLDKNKIVRTFKIIKNQ
jgi:hypothetical protein